MPQFARVRWLPWLLIYLTLAGWFLVRLASFYDSQRGLTSLILFGENFQPQRLQRLEGLPIYTFKKSGGYDGQFYAQLAVVGSPFDPGLHAALDSPAYRSRRILLPLLAHVAGLGRPWWILNAYAALGIVCWLIFASVLALWWFPPGSLENLLRWGGCLFGAGMIVSVTRSLTDGPSMLLLAFAIRALERNRRWLGAALLATAAFARETTILCAVAVLPASLRDRRGWIRSVLEGLVCIVPIALWIAIVNAYHGYSGYAGGTASVTWPLASAIRKVQLVFAAARRHGLNDWVRADWFTLVSLGVQGGFILARPRWTSPLWRIGAVFVVLSLFLSWPMWDDTPAPIARYLLPVTFAFNRLVPSGRSSLMLLALGNLSVAATPTLMRPPIFENHILAGEIWFDYGRGWYGPEHLGTRDWCWASGSTTIILHNPTSQTFVIKVNATLTSNTDRTLTLGARDRTNVLALKAGTPTPTTFGPFPLSPGDTHLEFRTAEPPWIEPGAGKRPLAFSIERFSVEIVPAPP
jgi:hypothetical protein